MRPLVAYKTLSGSPHLTWSLGTGRSKWMRRLMAFTAGPFGFYECERMPFGLTNTPATFQRLMETCLGDLNLHWCITYQDDIVIFSKDLASHLERLNAVFRKLKEAGLKLKPFKMQAILVAASLFRACDFFPRNSHWWRQDLGYQELAHTHEHHGGSKFLGIHRVLPLIHP